MVKRGERGHGEAGWIIGMILFLTITNTCTVSSIDHGIQRIACERALCPTPTVEPLR